MLTIARVEAGAEGTDTRYIVTNLAAVHHAPRRVPDRARKTPNGRGFH
jgi:hypothetical protein